MAPLVLKSCKAHRVTSSVMGAKLVSLSDMFDAAYTLAEELRYLNTSIDLPAHLFTDRKKLFGVISKETPT